MDDPSTLRRKAEEYLERAEAAASAHEAEKLLVVGRQLELWADEFEEIARAHRANASGNERS